MEAERNFVIQFKQRISLIFCCKTQTIKGYEKTDGNKYWDLNLNFVSTAVNGFKKAIERLHWVLTKTYKSSTFYFQMENVMSISKNSQQTSEYLLNSSTRVPTMSYIHTLIILTMASDLALSIWESMSLRDCTEACSTSFSWSKLSTTRSEKAAFPWLSL